MRHLLTCCVLPVLLLCLAAPGVRAAGEEDPPEARPIDLMLGETLSYDVSFLWFRRLAEGTISLRPGPQPGQYVALLEARTLGLTAFLTRHRIERIETLMELGPEGLLRPLLHQAHTIKGEGESRHERIRSYRYDHNARTVFYRNWKTGQAASERRYPMEKPGPVYDILSAFYNVRAGRFGALTRGRHVAIPTFTRRGTEDVVVARVAEQEQLRQSYFPPQSLLCKVLVNPETFGTRGRDIFVQFDERMVPQRAVVKNVIGLGDVRGILREIRSDTAGDLLPGAPREGEK
jgi:hypothetical protein